MNPVLLLLLSYLLGAVPTSFWVGKGFYRTDLRCKGSGSLGATNAFRVLGWKAAIPVVAVDMGKGWIPVALFPALHGVAAAPGWVLAYGAAAIVGHVFSVWVRFRGGKGVATSAGVLLGLAPVAVGIAFAVWCGAVLTTRMVSVGSILAALALPAAVALTPHVGGARLVWFTGALAVFVVWAHRANIARIARGEENQFGKPPRARAQGLDRSGRR